MLQSFDHAADLLRPRMRGWLHAWAAVAGIVVGAEAVALSPAGRTRASVALFAVSVALVFGTSAAYHRVRWTPAWRRRMARLDHSMIFLLIAASYTPFALLVMSPQVARPVLGAVWSGAALGIATRTMWHSAPPALMVGLYLCLGWTAVLVLPDILHRAGVGPLVLLLVGGGLYTAGAIVYALRRPDPLPAIFGYHEVFHLCTVVAASCHYACLFVVLDAAVTAAP